MIPNDGFSPLIIQNQSLGDMVQSGSGGELGTIGAPMEHEGRTFGGLPVLRPEISHDASRRDLPGIIERDFNGYGAEEVVKEHSIADITPSRLEEHMNMLCGAAIDRPR